MWSFLGGFASTTPATGIGTGVGFGTQQTPVFGQTNSAFQLQNPPIGNKRNKKA